MVERTLGISPATLWAVGSSHGQNLRNAAYTVPVSQAFLGVDVKGPIRLFSPVAMKRVRILEK